MGQGLDREAGAGGRRPAAGRSSFTRGLRHPSGAARFSSAGDLAQEPAPAAGSGRQGTGAGSGTRGPGWGATHF